MDISSMSSVYNISVFFFIIIIIEVLRCAQLLLKTSKSFNAVFQLIYRVILSI